MPAEQPQQQDPWSLRASDADRDKYLVLLREAYAEGRLDAHEYEERMEQALAAKTYRALYPVLTDLPIDPARVPGPPITGSNQPAQTGAQPPARYLPVAAPPATGAPTGYQPDNSVVAIFGSASRAGSWMVPAELNVLSVMGEATIDLTGAILSGMNTELRCNAVLGSVKVIVPDALHLEVNGSPVLGEFETKDRRKGQDKRRMPAPNAPQVRITGTALLGGVEVHIVVPRDGATVSMLNPALPPAPQPPAINPPNDDS